MAASAAYVAEYVCTVCGDCSTEPPQFSEEVPIFRNADGKKVEGWNYRIASCSSCHLKLGRPIKVLHRPYERDLAVFEKARDPVILQNSGPKDD